jgi:polysaccharide biosynthesis/export protein
METKRERTYNARTEGAMFYRGIIVGVGIVLVGLTAIGSVVHAQNPPPNYVIGVSDVLSIVFWRDKEMSADVTVRPDGKISLPLLNEITVTGATPEELRVRLTAAAKKFVEDPDVYVVVKEIHGRTVYITGSIAKPSGYPLNDGLTVLQLIAVAGGLQEYADAKNIVVIRTDGGHEQRFRFNYKDSLTQKHRTDNIVLRPGDTVLVP